MSLLKYLIMALIIFLVINYNQVFNTDNTYITDIAYTLIALVIGVFVLENYFMEGFTPFDRQSQFFVGHPNNSSNVGSIGNILDSDNVQRLIVPSIGNNVSYDDLPALLADDRQQDLQEQYPNFMWDYHTQMGRGKDRSYVNWEHIYS